MQIQNISGSDVVTANFNTNYTPKTEHIPTDQTREVKNERPVEENKGANIDAVA